MRTYLCVDYCSQDALTVVLPAVWPDVQFKLPMTKVPFQFRSMLHPGFACRVDVKDVQSKDNLELSDWGLH